MMKRQKAKIWVLALLSMAGGTVIGQTTPYTGGYAATSANDLWNGSTEFFIYNPGKGLWVQPANARHRYNNSTSTTHLSVGETGFAFRMTDKSTSGDNHVKISPLLTASKEGVRLGWRTDESMLIFDQTFTNTGHGSDWYFGVGRNGTYILHDNGGLLANDRIRINTTGGRTYLGIDTRSNSNSTSSDDEEWIFVTESTRRNTMKNYDNQGKTFDVSYWMGNYDFRRGYRDDWDANRKRFQEDQDGGNGDWSEEFKSCYVHNVWNSNNYRISQTIGDLPNGHYRFRVQAAYRDGNRADVGARWTNGTENLRAKYYIYSNDDITGLVMGSNFIRKENSVKSILSEAPTTSTSYWNTLCENSGRYVPDNADDWSRLWGNNTEAYWNDYIDVFVTNHSLSLGIYKNGNSGGDWLCMSEFQLLYYEATKAEYQSVLKHYTDVVRPMFDRLSTEVKNTWREKLETAEARANGNADGPSVGDYEASIDDMRELYNVKDMSTLIRTCILAEAEGAESAPINNAWTFISSVVADNNNYDEGTYNDHLNKVRVARKVAHIEQDNATYTGHTPAAGNYYLYNVGRKAYLSSGSDWGTHATLGWPGLEATLAASGSGFTIQFNELIQGDARDKYLSGSPYVDADNDAKGTYVFEAVSGKPGVYHIHGSGGYLAFDPDGAIDGGGTKHFNTVTALWSSPTGEDAEWMLVTKADRLAQLDNALVSNPVDATVLIRDASFNKFAALDSPWSDLNQGWEWGNRNFGDKNTETFNSQTYNLSQTITLPKKGIYEVSVQAYYRDGNRDPHASRIVSSEALHAPGVLYAGSAEQPLVYIHAEADMAPGEGTNTAAGNYPDNMLEASKFFQNGLYWNRVRVETTADNTSLTIGIRKTGTDHRADNWIVADNFRLTYLGDVRAELADHTFTGNTTTALYQRYNTEKASANSATNAGTPFATVIDRVAHLDEVKALLESVDDTELEDYLALAREEESTMTTGNNRLYAEALDFITNGTTPEGLTTALNKVKGVRKVNAMKRFVTPVSEGSTPAAGTFYLYNVGTGLWLCNGSDWGTHAAVDYYGIPVTLDQHTNNGITGYRITTKVNGADRRLGFGAYTDTPAGSSENDIWTFRPVTVTGKTNVYNIVVYDKTDDVLAYNPDGATDRFKNWNTVSKETNVPTSFYNDPNAQWMLVSEAQRDALLSGANPGNLIEANHKIVNPALSNIYPGKSAWTDFGTTQGTGPFNWENKWTWQQTGAGHFSHITSGESTETMGNQRRCHNYGMEFYDFQTFRLSQTLTGLQPGTYRVSVQAFYRAGGSDAAAESKAYLYATGAETARTALPRPKDFVQKNVSVTRTTESGTTTANADLDYLPGVQNGQRIDNAAQALEAFESGMFLTEVEAFVGEDGTLTIGVEQPEDAGAGYGQSWVVIDNFRIDYMGPYQPAPVGSIQWAGFATEADLDFSATAYLRNTTTKAVTSGQVLTAYKVVDTSEKYVVLEEVTDATEGTGLVINAPEGTNFVRLKSTTGTDHTDNMLKVSDGTVTGDYETTHRIYVLSNKNGLGFYPVKSSVTIPKGKVYLEDDTYSSGGAVKEYMLLGLGDDETGLSPIGHEAAALSVYDLSGRVFKIDIKNLRIFCQWF